MQHLEFCRQVLFPELGEHLTSPFGTDLMDDEDVGRMNS